MSAPYWPLDQVKALAARREGLVLSQTKAVAFFPDAATAYAMVKQMIANLSSGNFSRTVRLSEHVADV